MSIQSIREYFEQTYQDCIDTVSEVSKSTPSSPPHVMSDIKIYNFDKISKKVFSGQNWCSADGVRLGKRKVEFIEFKTGFYRRITKENWNPQLALCPRYQIPCNDYKKLFFKIEELEMDILIDSIKNKAIESFITWEKHILPNINLERHITLEYIAIIDGDEMERYENILSDLASTPVKPSNKVVRVRDSISRLCGCRDADDNSYFYDHVHVYTLNEYQKLLDSGIIA